MVPLWLCRLERRFRKPQVEGSNPSSGSPFLHVVHYYSTRTGLDRAGYRPPAAYPDPENTERIITTADHQIMIGMPFLPVALITIFGLPLAIYLGAATIIALITTATLGMLVLREGSSVPFAWHVNVARLTIALALVHGLVVYWTFF